MSFYQQPNKYLCGPFALKYALVMLGIFKNENEIAKYAGSTWWAGTDETGLERAAKKYGCTIEYFNSHDSKKAIELLDQQISAKRPCILSVNNWEHWVTILNQQDNKYITVDSSREKVITILSRSSLLKKWKYSDHEGNNLSFDGYAVIPGFEVSATAIFTLENARYIMRENNSSLARNWDVYFNDLVSVCRVRTKGGADYISLQEFMNRYETVIAERVAFWHGLPPYGVLKKILKNFRFVAEVYDLVIDKKYEQQAIVDFSSILMMYVCETYGI